jgi:hypothetical protein
MNYTIEPWRTKALDKNFLDIRQEIASLGLGLNANHPIDGSDTFERDYILWEALNQISHLEGDFVQCGVYVGEQAFFMAKHSEKKIHLFDSFKGATNFDESDNDFYRESPFKCSVEECLATLAQFNNVSLYVGEVPTHFDKLQKISFLHLDMDLYRPTKIAISELWPNIVYGGMVMVDTHDNISTGVTKAVQEFAKMINKEIQMLPTGIAVITK